MSETSQALKNIRSFAIVAVVSFHSLLAYLASQPAASGPFDLPPYHWMAIPILDRERWFGFDLYSAFNYVSLMPLMFLLSGLFVLPSLRRKGAGTFMRERLVRLGLPLVLGLFFLMPLAYYPVYRLSASSPSFVTFFSQWLALPVWPAGPLWFLWQLLAFDLIFAGIFLLIPHSAEALAQFAGRSSISDRRCFVLLLVFSAAAYIPLALIFGPWNWIYFGPTAIQPDRVLLYGVYFVAGAGIGAYGLQNGLLSTDGPLVRHWRVWLAAAAGSFLLWMICMAALRDGKPGMPLSLAAYFTVALLVTSACFCFIAVSLRFATGRSALCNSLSDNAYRIYVVHYLFVVWLQYLLLGASLPAIVKGTTVFVGTLALSWGAAVALGQVIPLLTRAIEGKSAKFAVSRASQNKSVTAWSVSRDRSRGATRRDRG
jgi:surface polysaccharide O-acyltransferase-like enzyme